jgi:CDGSH-type Zn-finger protein
MTKEDSGNSPVLECAEDGPYLVKGAVTLKGADGAPLRAKKVTALCRCGGSKNKPFCDGTHTEIGFSGAKSPDGAPDRRETYVGKDITIFDNRALCAHAGVCTDRLALVWRMGEEPWIDPDGAAVDAIIETIEACPSGALGYARDGETSAAAEHDPEVQVVRGGPYRVVGTIELKNAEWGEGASRDRCTLCRCGGSKNKPFCDGSHWDLDFDNEE